MYVNMSNTLIRAAQGLDIHEKRLLMFALGKMDSRKPVSMKEMVVRIPVKSMIDKYNLGSNHGYSDTKAACEGLMNRYIRFTHNDTDGKAIETRIQWVGRASYKENEGWVEIAFWHELFPMIFDLQSFFTSYKLERMGGLQSIYSWRLFELIQQFKRTGLLKIGIDEFAEAMEAKKSMRYNFANMRQRIIEPAVKEIREKDQLNLAWNTVTKGRKVTGLEFRFPVEQQKKIPLAGGSSKKAASRQTKATDEELQKREAAAEKAHMKKLAAMAADKGGASFDELMKGTTTA